MWGPEERCVCDLTTIMRTRLLCGLYSRRAAPPRWRWVARAYCLALTVAVAILIFLILKQLLAKSYDFINYLPVLAQFFVAQVVSLWSGDEYIYKFFTLNRLTDVSLDSPTVFNRLQKQLTQTFVYISVYIPMFAFVFWRTLPQNNDVIYNMIVMAMVFLTALLELVVTCSYASKFLVMSLFNARMLVLKRRLQRYGFRVVGRAPPQPYFQIYDEIIRMLDATDNPLKVLVFFDVIFSGAKLMSVALGCLLIFRRNMTSYGTLIMYLAVFVPHVLICSYGNVALLDSAAGHCEDMAVFTATQLIKTPTDLERERMRELLSALEKRGARYRVFRALPLDGRFVLRALSFLTAQVIIFANAIMD